MTVANLRFALLAGAALALAMPAFAHDTSDDRGRELFKPGLGHAATQSAAADPSVPPLYEGLGDAIGMAVTTASPDAQAYFDQGLRLYWGFNHAEARRSFAHGRTLDPDCAMCWWGEALAMGPNINDPMDAADVRPTWDAIQQARALASNGTEMEAALIEALAARYGANAMAQRPALDAAWARAIGDVAANWPDEVEIQTLHAEALMNLQPWDYWEADGVTPKGHGGDIVAALERALAIAPGHPGAAHLYIHAVEASADPGRAEAAADALRGAAPAAGHLTHMPAHIYMRVGRHHDSIAVNRDAVAADEAFLAQAGDAASPLWRFGYYPHNVHFLLVSAQLAGVKDEVIPAAEKLAAITSQEVSREIAWVQAIMTAPYSAAAQFGTPEEIAALADPGAAFPFVRGFWHYARGISAVASGDTALAAAEQAAIARLLETADLSGLEEQYLPASDVLGIAEAVLAARIARAAGDLRAAEARLREAVRLQDGIPYMEPPYWYYPVRQSLGAVLLERGRAEEAVEAFEAALAEVPRNGWALWGLAEALAAADDPRAAGAREAFEEVWLGDRSLLRLDRL
jgi:tetratricopeptide (TPR) repeat protein